MQDTNRPSLCTLSVLCVDRSCRFTNRRECLGRRHSLASSRRVSFHRVYCRSSPKVQRASSLLIFPFAIVERKSDARAVGARGKSRQRERAETITRRPKVLLSRPHLGSCKVAKDKLEAPPVASIANFVSQQRGPSLESGTPQELVRNRWSSRALTLTSLAWGDR